jgi:hypothetical protein
LLAIFHEIFNIYEEKKLNNIFNANLIEILARRKKEMNLDTIISLLNRIVEECPTFLAKIQREGRVIVQINKVAYLSAK